MATGGAPMRPGGKIYLCGRNDGNGDRHFHGELAHLALYDVGLSEDEVLKGCHFTVYYTHSTLHYFHFRASFHMKQGLLCSVQK